MEARTNHAAADRLVQSAKLGLQRRHWVIVFIDLSAYDLSAVAK
jgi:hypothetical protein